MVLIDGRYGDDKLVSLGLNYGYGVFETIKIINNRPIFLKEHMTRLMNSAEKLGIGKIERDRLIDNINKVINDLNPKAIKINILKGEGENYNELIMSRPFNYSEKDYKNGYKLCTANSRRNEYSPIVYHKTNNYLQNIIEFKEARKNGYDECLFQNTQGFIAEGAISNIFFIQNKTIYTPSIDCGILNGIIRDKVLELANQSGLECIETKIKPDHISNFQSGFICNSLMNIMPLKSIDGYKLPKLKDDIMIQLMNKLQKEERD